VRTPGVPVSLVTVRTRDGLSLAGLLCEPRRRRRTAFIWIHGLGSAFANGQPLIRALARRLPAAGFGYLKCDTRGHHLVARAGRRLAGAAFERFGDSVRDVRAAIDFARRAGYRRVILAGHSTGANKALHYMARVRDRRVAGLMLLGPISDVAGELKRVGPRELRRRVAVAERLARRDPDALVPRAFGVYSAQRYLSLYRPGSAEDVFPYYREGARWTALGRVRVPLAVMVGDRDQYLDRPAATLIAAFARYATRTRSFDGIVVPGANHGFEGREEFLARVVVAWIERRAR